MPYKDPERKKEWERLHRAVSYGAPKQREKRPRTTVAHEGSSGAAFLVPLVAGGGVAINEQFVDSIRGWRYKPTIVGGKSVAACSDVGVTVNLE
jgi:hypothetical protein